MNKITIPNIKSSSIKKLEYDIDNNELDITFIGNSVYRYHEITLDIWDKLKLSESKGRYFHQNIRSKFKVTRLDKKEIKEYFFLS